MAESIIEQSKKSRGARGLLKNKLFIIVIILLGGGALWVCVQKSPQLLDFIGRKMDGAADSGAQNSAALQAPDEDADVMGMVEAVSGNEITVLVFDPSAVDVPITGSQDSSKKTETSENAISLGQTSSMPGGGGMPSGGGMPGVRSSGSSSTKSSSSSKSSSTDSSSQDRETIMSELKSASTGKQKIVVPIGIPIRETGSVESATFKDLTSDTMVKVWLKKTDDGKNVAEFVDITGKVNMSNSNN